MPSSSDAELPRPRASWFPSTPRSSTRSKNSRGGADVGNIHHEGGVHALFADGLVQFITDSIEAADQTAQSVARNFNDVGEESPYGLWGALGTIRAKEQIEEAFDQ